MARKTRSAKWHTQNYLRGASLARVLVDQARLTRRDVVYEIGAGTGMITALLADRCRAVVANEIDRRLCAGLRVRFADYQNVQIRCRDFLSEALPHEPYKVLANPPFDITSAIIAKLVSAGRSPEDIFLVVQREAAARYCGMPDETLAALLLKPFFAPAVVHHFERTDFVPAPSVEVVMLRLRKRGPPLVAPADAQAYRDVVVSCFTAWRPTISAALARPLGPRAMRRLLDAADLNPALRPAQVPFDAWLRLFATFMRMPKALRTRVAGAEARLRRQQSHLRKEHRSRAPRDALGSGWRVWPVGRVQGTGGDSGFSCHALRVNDPKATVRRGYDLVSRAYRADDASEGKYAEWLDVLEAQVPPPAMVLDLGCGCGVPVARRLSPRYEVIGVDLSPVQIERARALVPTATFRCADMTATEFPEASFDAIVCLYALIHVPLVEQPGLLGNIGRWLRPGGLLIATMGGRAWTGVEKDWLGVPGGDMWWSHADPETYRRWLADAGLLIEQERFVPEGQGGHVFVVASR
ncbi:MAG: rRNA adenine N-6-methyltransferase family protein [Candidatus Limnocylindria bacterium]